MTLLRNYDYHLWSAQDYLRTNHRGSLIAQERKDGEDSTVIVWSHLQTQLGEDAADVLVDGGFRDEQLTGNRGIRAARSHEREDIAFAR